jgi:2-haloacid dehalogenase
MTVIGRGRVAIALKRGRVHFCKFLPSWVHYNHRRVVQATKVKGNVRAEIRVVAFDFYGTLVDLTAIARACTDITPNAGAFSATWRAKQLEYTFWLSLMNRYGDFDRITEAALNFTLERYGIEIDAVQREALMSAWAKPTAHPDVLSAVSKLAAKYQLVVLSNGTARSLADGLAHLGLGGYFRRVLSVDAVRVYKPAYQLVLDQCQVTKAEVLFVSSKQFRRYRRCEFWIRGLPS